MLIILNVEEEDREEEELRRLIGERACCVVSKDWHSRCLNKSLDLEENSVSDECGEDLWASWGIPFKRCDSCDERLSPNDIQGQESLLFKRIRTILVMI